jgi:hypothetical protein
LLARIVSTVRAANTNNGRRFAGPRCDVNGVGNPIFWSIVDREALAIVVLIMGLVLVALAYLVAAIVAFGFI